MMMAFPETNINVHYSPADGHLDERDHGADEAIIPARWNARRLQTLQTSADRYPLIYMPQIFSTAVQRLLQLSIFLIFASLSSQMRHLGKGQSFIRKNILL